jgi:hypothetical protein
VVRCTLELPGNPNPNSTTSVVVAVAITTVGLDHLHHLETRNSNLWPFDPHPDPHQPRPPPAVIAASGRYIRLAWVRGIPLALLRDSRAQPIIVTIFEFEL